MIGESTAIVLRNDPKAGSDVTHEEITGVLRKMEAVIDRF